MYVFCAYILALIIQLFHLVIIDKSYHQCPQFHHLQRIAVSIQVFDNENGLIIVKPRSVSIMASITLLWRPANCCSVIQSWIWVKVKDRPSTTLHKPVLLLPKYQSLISAWAAESLRWRGRAGNELVTYTHNVVTLTHSNILSCSCDSPWLRKWPRTEICRKCQHF